MPGTHLHSWVSWSRMERRNWQNFETSPRRTHSSLRVKIRCHSYLGGVFFVPLLPDFWRSRRLLCRTYNIRSKQHSHRIQRLCRFENAVKDHPQMSSVKIIVNACRIKPVQTLCRLFFQLVQTSILFTNLLYVSSILKVLGVRSLANASQARQFNLLNPPRVGWVKFIIFLRWQYLSAHACQIWARSVAKDFKQ